MNYLEEYKIIQHGSGIRCAWFNYDEDNFYFGRKVIKIKNNWIEEWEHNC